MGVLPDFHTIPYFHCFLNLQLVIASGLLLSSVGSVLTPVYNGQTSVHRGGWSVSTEGSFSSEEGCCRAGEIDTLPLKTAELGNKGYFCTRMLFGDLKLYSNTRKHWLAFLVALYPCCCTSGFLSYVIILPNDH